MAFSVAVAGASGYAGGELLRLLAAHPDFEVRTVTAHSNAGQRLVDVQPHLRSLAHLTLVDTTPETLAGHDIVFLALPHGTVRRSYTDAARPTPSSSTAAPTTASRARPTGPRSTAATTTAPGPTACPTPRRRRRKQRDRLVGAPPHRRARLQRQHRRASRLAPGIPPA